MGRGDALGIILAAILLGALNQGGAALSSICPMRSGCNASRFRRRDIPLGRARKLASDKRDSPDAHVATPGG
jgi:hypothetical protein